MSNNEVDNAVNELVKKKRKRPDLREMMTPNTEPGEISDMLRKTMIISHWPEINTNDPHQVSERIDQYHMFCLESDMKPSVVGMAMALGVDRTTLWKWENGVESNKPQAVRNLIKKGREVNEMIMVQMMQNGKLNPVTGIFLLKNNHGYKDQQEVVVSPQTPVTNVDPEQARKRIMDAIPLDTPEGTIPAGETSTVD